MKNAQPLFGRLLEHFYIDEFPGCAAEAIKISNEG